MGRNSDSGTICKQNADHLSGNSKRDRVTIREMHATEYPRSFNLLRIMVQNCSGHTSGGGVWVLSAGRNRRIFRYTREIAVWSSLWRYLQRV
jgi:hypothetical protein